MLDAIIVLIVFSVPLSAIIGSFWLKAKRIEHESGGSTLEPRLRALEAENRELRQRVETLETIVTSDEPHRGSTRVRVQPTQTAAPDVVESTPTTTAAQESRRA
jgi:predicted nuclease with TOPRIM domain